MHECILIADACKYMVGIKMYTIIGHSKEEILLCSYGPIQGYEDMYELALETNEIAYFI